MDLVDPPGVVLYVLVVLRIDRLHLTGCGALGEERGDEKLREAVQGTWEWRHG